MSIRKSNLDRLLAQDGPIILDGGLGSELDRRGYDISTPLWSAELLMNNPQAIKDIHRAYLDAGAQCITSASYQASIAGFGAMGLSPERARELFVKSVDLAKSAVDEFLQHKPDCGYQPLVAASIGPYGAYLADGSEYSGDYGVNDATLLEFHQQRLLWLDAAGADVLACETIPSLQEARVLRQLLEKVNTPAWISFSCQDERYLNDGSMLRQAVALFEQLPGVVAIGVNCTAPQYIQSLIGEIKAASWTRAIVVYPNSGEHYDADDKAWHGTETPLECAVAARGWYQAGAKIIGGCCRMGPAHVREIATELNADKQ
ncbi:MAG: homocysteine S-methyltransferase [Gammaproteobacteria bacterium]|nr:MAG: homocysteine S-methyltransferase [Gammaproteobacteria bacterium]